MPPIVNRGFTATLIALAITAELALRAAAFAPPHIVRVVYGTTLAMYLEVAARLRNAAPDVQVLAMGDSLALTQFQPDIFAADYGLPARAVFNASYLAQTFRSQESVLRDIGIERFPKLRQVLLFINPRRLTQEGAADGAVFRVGIPDPGGPLPTAWREKNVSPVLDYSRLYGLSRYIVTASWRQMARPTMWDEVEYLTPQGGVAFDRPRPAGDYPVYLYEPIDELSEELLADLKRVIEIFRARNISVIVMQSARHRSVHIFVNASMEGHFDLEMNRLAVETGSTWEPLAAVGFEPPADTDFLDYGHLNRSGGIAFTHYLRTTIPPIQ